MIVTSINIMVFVTIPLSLWLGYTGRVDWVLLGLMWLMHCSIKLKRRQRKW